jgi:Transcriptional regulators containing a DNA-binding HTH domain and an aminotransferase domain (MocR family) and their eukaryotic orthologs
MLPDQTALIAKSLNGLEKPAALDAALKQGTSVGTPAVRSVAAAYLSQGAWSPAPEQLVFTGNGRQSIAAALATVVPTGGRCGVEALTYPFIKGIAARLGISLVPLAMDEGGVRPDSVQKAHREAHLSPSTSSRRSRIRGHDDDRGAPGRSACALSKSSTFRSSRTMSTASSTMSRRLPRSRRTPALSSTVSPRRSRRA